MSLFKKRQSIPRDKFIREIEEAPSRIPGTSRRFDKQERVKMAKKFFKREHGHYFSKREYRDRLRELDRAKYKEKNESKRKAIEDKIRYFEERGGISRRDN